MATGVTGYSRHPPTTGACDLSSPRGGPSACVDAPTGTVRRAFLLIWRHAHVQPTSVIVAGARTPIGRLLGGLKDLSAADLGGVAIKGALEKAGVAGDQVDYVIMGQVIQAGAGQNPARRPPSPAASR